MNWESVRLFELLILYILGHLKEVVTLFVPCANTFRNSLIAVSVILDPVLKYHLVEITLCCCLAYLVERFKKTEVENVRKVIYIFSENI